VILGLEFYSHILIFLGIKQNTYYASNINTKTRAAEQIKTHTIKAPYSLV